MRSDLMAALVVEEREPRRIRRPANLVDAPGVGEQLVVDRDFLARGDVEQVRLRLSGMRSPGLR